MATLLGRAIDARQDRLYASAALASVAIAFMPRDKILAAVNRYYGGSAGIL